MGLMSIGQCSSLEHYLTCDVNYKNRKSIETQTKLSQKCPMALTSNLGWTNP